MMRMIVGGVGAGICDADYDDGNMSWRNLRTSSMEPTGLEASLCLVS